MVIAQLPFSYIRWHLGVAWSDLWRLYLNCAWFLFNLFSIKTLVTTLFSPWHRLHERKTKGSGGFFGQLIINTITRLVGAGIRTVVILTGLMSLLLCTVLFAGVFVAWVAVPFIAIGCIYFGVYGLVNASMS